MSQVPAITQATATIVIQVRGTVIPILVTRRSASQNLVTAAAFEVVSEAVSGVVLRVALEVVLVLVVIAALGVRVLVEGFGID